MRLVHLIILSSLFSCALFKKTPSSEVEVVNEEQAKKIEIDYSKDSKIVLDKINERKKELVGCYKLNDAKDSVTKKNLILVVKKNGEIKETKMDSGNQEFQKCIDQLVRSIDLPASSNKEIDQVVLKLPLNFKTK